MIRIDFDSWLSHHLARFTDAAGWLEKFKEGSSTKPSREAVVNAWYGILKDVELRHAKEATDLLAAGKEEFSGRSYDDHPKTVRAIAFKVAGIQKSKRKQQRTIDGEFVVDCPVCLDSGFVWIYHPSLLKFFRDNFSEELPPTDANGTVVWNWYWLDFRFRFAKDQGEIKAERGVAKCQCASGQGKSVQCVTFDPEQHVPYGKGDPREALTKLETLLAKRGGF